MKPIIKHGRFHAGKDFVCGENVVMDVDEEVILGDRVTLGDNTYLCGRYISIGDDFYGYSHWNKRLEVGLGRRWENNANMIVGSRVTIHDNKIDLACGVVIGDDVGLSPEVTLYTHYYWQSPLEGFPTERKHIRIDEGSIIGYRSTLLPGARVPKNSVVGAGSVVTGDLGMQNAVHGGVPAKFLKWVVKPEDDARKAIVLRVVREYDESLKYRNLKSGVTLTLEYPLVVLNDFFVNLETLMWEGEETEITDDFRWHLFSRGFRVYTQRRFKRIVP